MRSAWLWKTILILRLLVTTCRSQTWTSFAPKPEEFFAALMLVLCKERRAEESVVSEPALLAPAQVVRLQARVARAQALPDWCNRRWVWAHRCSPMIR